jgi:flavin-dependent dehydrogenase
VQIVDRARFPREKLCGDTLNPGTLAALRRLQLAEAIEARALPVGGMMITGERGVTIDGPYPRGLTGRAIVRAELDWLLLQAAINAGADFAPGVTIREAIVTSGPSRPKVEGATTGTNGTARALRARVTIAADGRRSVIAFGLKLARHPAAPRRWAIGGHYADMPAMPSRGEMHIRRARYIGVAPLPGGLTNICLVVPAHGGTPDFSDPQALLEREIAREPAIRDRFASARLVRAPMVLGPLAVDTSASAIDGVLLAGDASGFVDPMTGDGMRFAVRGGELAALSALEALEHGWPGVHGRLAAARQREFGAKWRFNRALRALVGSPAAVSLATRAAALVPAAVRAIVTKAGDCDWA